MFYLKKKLLLFITFITFIVIFAGCNNKSNLKDSSLEDIKKKGQFVVGLDDSFPPMGFKDDKGEIVGFDIDVAKEAAKRMGVKVVFKSIDWDGVLLSLKNKDIDVIWNGLTVTKDREKHINFSKVYLQNRQIIVVKKDSNINKKEDLSGKIVGLQLGSSSEAALKSQEKLLNSLKEVKKYSNNVEALMDLSSSRIDGVIVDEVVGRYYVNKKKDTYKILGEDLGKESYGVGIRKEDKSFKEELDKVLDQMKKDGTLDSISKKWFGENITER